MKYRISKSLRLTTSVVFMVVIRTTLTGEKMVRLPVRFLKIKEDVAIGSAPLEWFIEVANEVRQRSPFPYTFYFGYSNGWLGYLLTEPAWKEGGYEIRVSPFTPAAATDLTEAVVNYLQGYAGGKNKNRSNARRVEKGID